MIPLPDELRRLYALSDYHLDRAESIGVLCRAVRLPADAETWKLVRSHEAALRETLDAIQAYSNGPAAPYDSAAAKRQLAAAAAEILSEQHGGEKARAA